MIWMHDKQHGQNRFKSAASVEAEGVKNVDGVIHACLGHYIYPGRQCVGKLGDTRDSRDTLRIADEGTRGEPFADGDDLAAQGIVIDG
jgi:hypothetical protein